MTKRRAFVPAAPNYASLEDRIAPANIFGLGTWWDHRMGDLGFSHYKHHAASTPTIQPAHPAAAKAAHQVNAPAKAAVVFK